MGAGPAGATAALAALHADPALRVLLLDRSDFPRDKSCGDGIAPHCFEKLASIGVTGVEDGWTPLTRLELARGDESVAGTMARPVYVIPREVFDARLVERRGGPRRDVPPAAGRLGSSELPDAGTPVVVGADGAHSVLRAAPRAAVRPPRAGDPRLRADPAGPARHPGDPVRRPPAAGVRVGLRPRRRAARTSGTASCCRPTAKVTRRRGRCCSTSSSSCCPARSTRESTGRATTCRCPAGAGSSPTAGCCSPATRRA